MCSRGVIIIGLADILATDRVIFIASVIGTTCSTNHYIIVHAKFILFNAHQENVAIEDLLNEL